MTKTRIILFAFSPDIQFQRISHSLHLSDLKNIILFISILKHGNSVMVVNKIQMTVKFKALFTKSILKNHKLSVVLTAAFNRREMLKRVRV